MKKIISLLTLASVIIPISVLTVKPVNSTAKTYGFADVIEISGQTVAVVPNGSGIETLSITSDNKIKKLAEAVPGGNGIKPQSAYVKIENGKAVAYVAAGAAVQKYDISSPSWPALIKSIDSPVGFTRDIAGKSGTSLILIAGDKGVKEMETNGLSPIRDVWNGTAYGVDVNDAGKMVINSYDKGVTLNPNGSAEFVVNLKHAQPALKKPFITPSGTGFVADDNGVKKIGAEVVFASPSGFGFSIDADSEGYLYFVNGWGVYKLDKNLNQIDFQTINLVAGWAQGIKVFQSNGKTKILVLASDRIYLLDENLSILDTYTYQPMRNLKTIGIDDDPAKLQIAAKASPADQPLSVRVSKAPVKPGDIIKVYATGFYSGEPLTLEVGAQVNPPDPQGNIIINKDNLTEKSVADGNGNQVFEHIIIPEQKTYPIMINIRVFGQNSKRQYSLALRVEKPEPPKPVKPEIVNLETHTETVKEIETTREVTEETQGNKTIIHEIIHTIEKLVERQIAELEIRENKITIVRGGVAKNTYVRWINKDKTEHSVATIETPSGSETFDSGKLKQDANYQFKFKNVGAYKYVIDGKKDIVYEIIVQ
ncbi:MAG: hypothetical protein ABH896_04700 [Candidatus Jacksonbacteria bacterium]